MTDLFAELRIPTDYGRNPRRPRFQEAKELEDVEPNLVGTMQRLAPETAAAWRTMKQTAADAGVQLLLVSGFRSVAHQADIIRRKLVAGQSIDAILAVNAAPGFSEHHTGRAIDVASPGTRPSRRSSSVPRRSRGLRRMRAGSVSACRTDAAIASVSNTSRGTGRESRLTTGGAKTRASDASSTIHSRRLFMHRRLLRLAPVGATLALLATSAHAAETIRQWQFAQSGQTLELALREVAAPTPAATEVAVRVRAASLNRRDLMMAAGNYGRGGTQANSVPLSDGAGEVVAVGANVTRFKVGDRVAGIFFEDWIDGAPSAASLATARGGNSGGMLSEIVVTDAEGLVSIPAHLSFEEAATLPCAGVTAWVGLFKRGGLEPGDFVLLEGTGGVSVFGLQLAAAAGAKPIITSSSDAKLARARELGAFGTVNYRSNPEWQREVRELTGGAGVDHVLEVGGQDTLPRALQALGFGGHVAIIGGLSGFASDVPVGTLMGLNATASGIYVGSRADFEALNAFLSKHQIKPIVDKVFDLEDAPAAFEAMDSGDFFGKVVIRL